MEPDLDQLRLQQLLQPFNNQGGVMSTNSAIPMINGIPMINTGMIDQNLQNTDLVQQIIAENQARTNPFVRPNMLDIAGGVVPGGITEITSSNMNLQKPNSLSFGTNYGVANTPDVIGDFLGSDVYQTDDGRAYYIDSKGEKILAPQKAEYYKQKQKPSGIAKLFEFLRNIPTPFSLARRGLESLSGLNQKLRGTTFGMSPTLKDYFQAKKAEKIAAAGADVGVGGEGRGSRRGDADISSSQRGSFATDDTAGFF